MLESLSDRLQGVFGGLKSKGRLTPDDIDAAMREVRMALLEADVNYKVVKTFVAKTKERCMGADVLESLTPAQNVVKIVLDELTELLGGTSSRMVLTSRIPNVIMLVGLQGRSTRHPARRPPRTRAPPSCAHGHRRPVRARSDASLPGQARARRTSLQARNRPRSDEERPHSKRRPRDTASVPRTRICAPPSWSTAGAMPTRPGMNSR